jgi:predicted nucleic acid-binding protein
MGEYFCYTTVFQAIELFAVMRSAKERKAAEDCLSAMKLLGLNPKRAARYGELFRKHTRHRVLDLLIAGLCLEGGLPLLTERKNDFKGISGLKIVRPIISDI